MLGNNQKKSLDQQTFQKLRRLYIIALSAIALSLVISQILIRNHLEDQQSDSTVINVAGRQRMLSQKMTKEVLMLSNTISISEQETLSAKLKKTYQIWSESHHSLQKGNPALGLPGNNSTEVVSLYSELDTHYKSIDKSILNILSQRSFEEKKSIENDVKTIMENEQAFLRKMDEIVNQYDKEADDKGDTNGDQRDL